MVVNRKVVHIENAGPQARFLGKVAAHHGESVRDISAVVLGQLRDLSFREFDVGGLKLFKLFGVSRTGGHRVTISTFKPTTRSSFVNPHIPVTISFEGGPSVFLVKQPDKHFAYGATEGNEVNSHSGFRSVVDCLQDYGLSHVNALNSLAEGKGKHYGTVSSGSKRALISNFKDIAAEEGHDELHPVIDALTRGMSVSELHDSRDVAKLIGSFDDEAHNLVSVVLHKGKGNLRYKPLISISQHVSDFNAHNPIVTGGVHVLRELERGGLVFTHFEDDDYLKNNPGVARAVKLLKAHGIEER